MSATKTLDDKVTELRSKIDAKKAEAQTAWAKFDGLRTELAKGDVDVTDDKSDAFTKAHEANQAYGILADEVHAMQERLPQLLSMTGERQHGDPGTPAAALRERVKDGLRSRETHGARVATGELYKEALAARVFERNSQSKIGQVNLGQMMDREEFHALIAGANPASAGAMVFEDQTGGYYQRPDRPLLITDLITVGTTDSDVIQYVRETAFTNNAAETPEATDVTGVSGTKPQSMIAYERVSENVKEIAHWIATTRRALADAAQLRSMIDGRLVTGLNQRLETQIIAGNGAGENLLGIYNQPGILTQSRGSDSLLDAIFKGMTKLRLAFHEPSATGINPLDWQDIRLSKNLQDDYYFGAPGMAGTPTAWGVPLVSGPQFPQHTPMTGDFSQVQLWIREGIEVFASDSHADFFTRNLMALLAEMRVALGLPLPEALCEITA